MAVKDEQGRVHIVVEQNPGSTVVSSAIDRTMQDKVTIAGNVIENMQVPAARRSAQTKKARIDKKQEAGYQRKNKQVPHPVEVVDESADEEDEDSDVLEEATFANEINLVDTGTIRNVKVELTVRGIDQRM